MLDDMPDRSLGHAATNRQLWTASLQATLLAAAAMMLAAWLAWLTVPARWVTPGYPSQIGYGKNVELAGLLAGALVAIALALLCFWQPLRWR